MDLQNYAAQKAKGLVTIQSVGVDTAPTALVIVPVFHPATGEKIGTNAEQLNLKGIDDAIADVQKKRLAANAEFDANEAALNTLRADVAAILPAAKVA